MINNIKICSHKSSKLQQLFGDDSLTPEDKQQSLKYQRPKANDLKNKEIKENASAVAANTTSITLMAKVVTAYKQGELQGKVGMALIQNPDDSCNIIMYKTRQHILATLKLLAGEILLYKQTKYWQFYDEATIYWSFSFDSREDEEDFKEKLKQNHIIYKVGEEKEMEQEKTLDLDIKFNEESFIKPEVLEPPKDSKNSLLKRMAKMGKPLPTLTSYGQQTTTEFSDSSDTEVIKTPLASGGKPSIAPRSNKLAAIKTNQQLVSTMANPATTAVYPIQPLESQYMQMLLTEQRTQGSELRMNMNKLENKIEKVLDKLDLYDRTDGARQKPERDDEILELEEKILMLKKENRKLKQSLQEQNTKETEEQKIKDILNNFKEDLREFDINYKQDLFVILKELKDKLKEQIKQKQELQCDLEESKVDVKLKQKDLEAKLNEIQDLEKELLAIKQQEQEFKLKLKEQELEIFKLKEEKLDLQAKLQENDQKFSKSPDDLLVKSIMNNLYVEIAEKLENANLERSQEILALIAAAIKQQTLKSLQQHKVN